MRSNNVLVGVLYNALTLAGIVCLKEPTRELNRMSNDDAGCVGTVHRPR